MIRIPRQRALIELRRTGGKPDIPPARYADGRYRLSPDDGQPEKRCTKCHQYLPADHEFFHRRCGSTDDLMRWCKACIGEYQRHHHSKPSKGKQPCSS